MLNSIKMQMSEMLRKKTVVFTYSILMAFVITNFIINMLNYAKVEYISEMWDPMKVLTLSTWSESGFYLMTFYPILVCIPTSAAYLIDRETRMRLYIQSRTGGRDYWGGKLAAVFLTTFLIFTVPFLIELLLSCICFNITSVGDPSNVRYLDIVGQEYGYFMPKLWLDNRIVYAVLMTIIFGIVAGIFAVFNFSICTLPIFKYKIFTFFPIYVMLHIINIIDSIVAFDFEVNYFFLLRMFDRSDKADGVYFFFFFMLLLISVLIIRNKIKKDDIV